MFGLYTKTQTRIQIPSHPALAPVDVPRQDIGGTTARFDRVPPFGRAAWTSSQMVRLQKK